MDERKTLRKWITRKCAERTIRCKLSQEWYLHSFAHARL